MINQINIFVESAPSLFVSLVSDATEIGLLAMFCLQTYALYAWTYKNLSNSRWDRFIVRAIYLAVSCFMLLTGGFVANSTLIWLGAIATGYLIYKSPYWRTNFSLDPVTWCGQPANAPCPFAANRTPARCPPPGIRCPPKPMFCSTGTEDLHQAQARCLKDILLPCPNAPENAYNNPANFRPRPPCLVPEEPEPARKSSWVGSIPHQILLCLAGYVWGFLISTVVPWYLKRQESTKTAPVPKKNINFSSSIPYSSGLDYDNMTEAEYYAKSYGPRSPCANAVACPSFRADCPSVPICPPVPACPPVPVCPPTMRIYAEKEEEPAPTPVEPAANSSNLVKLVTDLASTGVGDVISSLLGSGNVAEAAQTLAHKLQNMDAEQVQSVLNCLSQAKALAASSPEFINMLTSIFLPSGTKPPSETSFLQRVVEVTTAFSKMQKASPPPCEMPQAPMPAAAPVPVVAPVEVEKTPDNTVHISDSEADESEKPTPEEQFETVV